MIASWSWECNNVVCHHNKRTERRLRRTRLLRASLQMRRSTQWSTKTKTELLRFSPRKQLAAATTHSFQSPPRKWSHSQPATHIILTALSPSFKYVLTKVVLSLWMQQKINGRQSLNRTNQGRAIGEGSHVAGPQPELRRQARSHDKQEKREIERINKGRRTFVCLFLLSPIFSNV